MLARVLQDVEKSAPDLERRLQHVLVRPISEHTPAPPPQSIQRSSDAHAEPSQAANERAPVVSLGDQVHVIPLHREVHQAKAWPLAPARERTPQRAERDTVAKARQAALHAQGHVHRMTRGQWRPAGV
jgi:hypothetical protein